MINETYENRTIYFFGEGEEKNLDFICKNKYSKILLHYGKRSIVSNGIYDKIINILNTLNIDFIELCGVDENPKSDLVSKGITLCKNNNIDFILAVGGGSVIDSAKAISIGSKYDGNFFDFFEGIANPKDAIDFGIVLTNSGSGSETSITSVITHKEKKVKKNYVNQLMRAKFAILNPSFTKTVPLNITTCGIVDSISHIFERYFTNTEFVDCSDRLSEALMQTLIKYALLIQKDPENYNYRAEIMWACKMASDQLIYLGRKQEWTCHYIAHEIGALTDKPHAEILSIIFPSWMKFVSKKNPKKFLQLFKRVFNVNNIQDGIKEYISFLISIKMPTTLTQIDFTDKNQFEIIAQNLEKINPSGTIGNIQRLDKNDILSILNMSI